MRLTTFSDYALRVLMYAGTTNDRLVTISETAALYNISRAHLTKVVNILTKTGYLKSVRGRSGGFMLAKRPEDIRLGGVIRATEPDFALVECFTTGNVCSLTRKCRLPNILNEALASFVETFDSYTLKDILLTEPDFSLPHKHSLGTRGPDFSAMGLKKQLHQKSIVTKPI